MIKANRGEIKIEGSESEVLADFTCITRTLIMTLNIPVEKIEELVGLSQKTDAEITEEFLKKLLEVAMKL